MSKPIIKALQQVLSMDRVLIDDELKMRYHHIWKMDEPLKAIALVMPKSTEEVSAIMKICDSHNCQVVVHGGLTNLVGSTETQGNEVVVSMEKMNQIEEVDAHSRTMTVQAGTILQNVQNAAAEQSLMFPLNFGAKGSAQIGGALSTNAGGLRVLRYGMTRNLVLGLEVVLADGTIMSSLKKIIKDNSGYDLKQLFIGAEGSLGIITRAVLRLTETPKSRTSAFVAFNTYDKVVTFLKYIDQGLSGTLSAYELIWGDTYATMTSPPALVGPPLVHGYKYYVLIEGQGGNQEKDQDRLQILLEEALETELILDAAIVSNDSEMEWFWKIREDVHVISSQCDHDQHFDVSIPIAQIGAYVDDTIEKLKEIVGVEKIFPFGHVADGNIHFIIGKKEQTPELIQMINDTIYQPLKDLGGSVSAEHGIGLHKKKYLNTSKSDIEIAIMQRIKKALDPKNLLNRGKVFDL